MSAVAVVRQALLYTRHTVQHRILTASFMAVLSLRMRPPSLSQSVCRLFHVLRRRVPSLPEATRLARSRAAGSNRSPPWAPLRSLSNFGGLLSTAHSSPCRTRATAKHSCVCRTTRAPLCQYKGGSRRKRRLAGAVWHGAKRGASPLQLLASAAPPCRQAGHQLPSVHQWTAK